MQESKATFVETGCTIEHEGKTFESGGAWLLDCTDGYRRGVVYARPTLAIDSGTPKEKAWACSGCVSDWHGNVLAAARFGQVYRGGFGGVLMRSVTFDHDGYRYHGRYGIDWSDAVRVKGRKVKD